MVDAKLHYISLSKAFL